MEGIGIEPRVKKTDTAAKKIIEEEKEEKATEATARGDMKEGEKEDEDQVKGRKDATCVDMNLTWQQKAQYIEKDHC